MKLLSIPALILILSALPLAATAADYGVGGGMLAASSPAPQLPNLDGGSTAGAAQDRADVPDAAGPTAAPAPAPAPAARPRAAGSRHVDKPIHPGKAAAPPEQPSWQSLLPGSIQ